MTEIFQNGTTSVALAFSWDFHQAPKSDRRLPRQIRVKNKSTLTQTADSFNHSERRNTSQHTVHRSCYAWDGVGQLKYSC